MRIGICDDENYWREQEKKLFEKYFLKSGESVEIFEFSSAEELAGQHAEP